MHDPVPASHSAEATPLRHVTVTGSDTDHARQTYQDAYGGTRFVATRAGDEFAFRYASVGDDRVTLRTSMMTGRLNGEIPHLREYVVSWFRFGGGELQRGRTVRAGVPSVPFLFPAEQHFAFAFSPHRQNLVHFAPDFLEDIATEFHDGEPRAVSFDHDAEPSPDAIARWRAAVSAAKSVLLDAAVTPLLRMNAQRPLARSLLQLFPWFGLDVPRALREPSLARTKVALEYLQHHAHQPITPVDAARAAGMHTRTLQQATRQHLGMSPSLYLRSVRLDRARRDLLAARVGTHTVAGIARDWGFGNLGRFSAYYQTAFAEKPYETLRR